MEAYLELASKARPERFHSMLAVPLRSTWDAIKITSKKSLIDNWVAVLVSFCFNDCIDRIEIYFNPLTRLFWKVPVLFSMTQDFEMQRSTSILSHL